MFIIRLISDLHLELRNYIPKDIFPDKISSQIEEILILAGDIGDPFTEIYKKFLTVSRSRYPFVIVIPGNHEFYNYNVRYTETKNSSDIIERTITPDKYPLVVSEPRSKIYSYSEVIRQMEYLCKHIGCVFLNNSSVIYKDIRFVGSVLWSSLSKENFPIAADNGIFKWLYLKSTPITYEEYRDLNTQSIKFLEEEISRKEKLVVITHYPLSKEMIKDSHINNPVSEMYYNNLEKLLDPNILLWVSGHTHQPKSIILNNIPIVSNPVGTLPEFKNTFGFNKNFSYTL